MCGIAGIWNFKQQLNDSEFKAYTDTLYHRGPDGGGYAYFDDHSLGLGHRRLSILDVSANGKQPMYAHNRKFAISYNGEVFNFIELKKELEALGHSFLSTTDTEVILAAYIQWGETCLHRFNGMWAIAIWDEENKSLFLARDRFGIKPLYYTYSRESLFAFASETNAFKHIPGFSREIDENLMALSMEDPYLLEGKGYSIFKGIYQLLPGHYLTISRNTFSDQKRWYDITKTQVEKKENFESSTNEFLNLFDDACKLRLRSDVPIATALSGGLDSSSVYASVYKIMQEGNQDERAAAEWQKAVIGIFPGTDVDEQQYADQVVNYIGGERIYADIGLNKDLPDLLEKSTRHFDAVSSTPFISMLGIYGAMKENGIKVSMDGHGVDEMMFGYRDSSYKIYHYHLQFGDLNRAKEIAAILIAMYPPDKIEGVKKRFDSEILNATSYRRSVKYKVKKLFKGSDIVSAEKLQSKSDTPYYFNKYSFEERTQYELFCHTTLPSLLRNFDKAAMYNSIEIRMPFMDYRLVEFVLNTPAEHRLGNGFTKQLLREAIKNRIPEEVRTRTWKLGLGIPLADWYESKIGDWMNDLLHSSRFSTTFDDHAQFIDEVEKLMKGSRSEVTYVEVWKRLNRILIE